MDCFFVVFFFSVAAVREDLLDRTSPMCPIVLDYKVKSLQNITKLQFICCLFLILQEPVEHVILQRLCAYQNCA